MEPLRFYVRMRAVPMGRPRLNGRYVYTPQPSKDFMTEFAKKVCEQYEGMVLGCGLKMRIDIFKKMPPTNKKYGDVDNLAKSILDAMTGIVYEDDSQIVDLQVKKHYTAGENAIVVEIEEI